MKHNRISVIIPYKQPAPYLQDTIASLESQTISSELEIIAIKDDGSGVSETRNRGLRKAMGEYVYFIDSDDVLVDKWILERARAVLRDNPQVDFVYGNLVLGDESLKPIGYHTTPDFHGKYLIQYLCRGGALLLQAMLFRHRKNMVLFDKTYRYSEDLDYILRRTYARKGMHLNMFFSCHREHANSLSYKREPGKAQHIVKTLDIFANFLKSHPEIIRSAAFYSKTMAVQSMVRVHMLLRFYYRKEAFLLFLKSFQYFPFCITRNIVRVIPEFLLPVSIARLIRKSILAFKRKTIAVNP